MNIDTRFNTSQTQLDADLANARAEFEEVKRLLQEKEAGLALAQRRIREFDYAWLGEKERPGVTLGQEGVEGEDLVLTVPGRCAFERAPFRLSRAWTSAIAETLSMRRGARRFIVRCGRSPGAIVSADQYRNEYFGDPGVVPWDPNFLVWQYLDGQEMWPAGGW